MINPIWWAVIASIIVVTVLSSIGFWAIYKSKQEQSLIMSIKDIKNNNDYQSALKLIEAHWDAEIGSTEAEELDALASLVESYEEANYAIEAPNSIEAIKFRKEQS
jgi:biopolymer transport protein ExbB/TolQ